MLRLRLLPCVLATAAAAKTVDWESMHPSSSVNTKSADAGETVTFNWDETHDVWLMPDEAAYNSCTFTNAVEVHSTSVKTGDVSGLGETKYYACHVGSHCDSGQKIAITWAVSAPTPRPTFAGALAGGAESSTEAAGGSDGGSDNSVMVAGGGAAAGAVLLLAAAAFFFYRRSKGSNTKQTTRGGVDAELGEVELEDGDGRSAMLARHKDTSTIVQHGLTLANALLSAGSGLPLVGELCRAVKGCLGSAVEFGDMADDVLIAAKRVCDVLDAAHLMAKNVARLEDERALVESRMRHLVDLLVEFNDAMRTFGKKGWLKRAFTMQGHVRSLGRLDKEICQAMDSFRDLYRLSADARLMEHTYQIERSIDQLVEARVRETGETAEAAARSLAEDPVAITSVAIEAHVPVDELTRELGEFRLEVKNGFAKVDKQLKKMLRNRGSEEQLATILAAVRASARREEELLVAADARAQRTTAQLDYVSGAVASGARRNEKFIVAAAQSGERRINAVEARVQRDGARLDGIKEEVAALGASMAKKTRKQSARDLKRTNLVSHELTLDRVEAEPVACGAQGDVHQAEYMGEAVALKKISLASLTAVKRQQLVSQFAQELSIMIRLRSPRTVAVLGVVTTDSSFLGLVMEFMPGGSIRQALDRKLELQAELKCLWASDVALGMQYLYSCGVQHRDLKSHNCLLTKEARAKVSDFGLSRCDALKTATTLTTKNGDGLAGTPAFMAPELLKDNVFTEKSDVYSYAMVLWELFDGGVPWAGHKPLQISFKVVFEHARPPVPPSMPGPLATVMRRAWANDAATRPPFADIVQHVRADQAQESSTAGTESDDENLRRALAASRLTGAAEERRRAESLAASPPPAPSRARQIEAARRQRYAEPGTTPRRPAAADRTWREGAGSPPALE